MQIFSTLGQGLWILYMLHTGKVVKLIKYITLDNIFKFFSKNPCIISAEIIKQKGVFFFLKVKSKTILASLKREKWKCSFWNEDAEVLLQPCHSSCGFKLPFQHLCAFAFWQFTFYFHLLLIVLFSFGIPQINYSVWRCEFPFFLSIYTGFHFLSIHVNSLRYLTTGSSDTAFLFF